MSWDTVIGHDWARTVLADAIRHDRVGHAYLLTGPTQVGKTTLARAFAQALTCTDPSRDARPCGHCRACRLIAADSHPDVRLIAPDVSGRGKPTLKIETMRQLQADLQLGAYEGPYKIAIITDFEAATTGAANAFLKTLEEPPSRVVLILTATDADTVLETIKSRCRVLALRPIPTPVIADALRRRWGVADAAAEQLAHIANGRLGWAVTAATDETLLAARRAHLDALQAALAAGRVQRFALSDELTRSAETLPAVLQTWIGWWRDLLLVAHTHAQTGSIANVDCRAGFAELAQVWRADTIHGALQATRTALWQLERNANARLVMENLLLRYPRRDPVPAAD